MRDFLIKLLSTDEGAVEISLFSIWHILWLLVIIGGTIGVAFLLRNKSENTRTKVVDILACSVTAVYILDFFLMPLSRTDFTIDVDKLPFHICTLMGIFVPFANFNKKFEKIKDAICCLTIVSSLMYMCYPGSAIGDILPWCYKVMQTFIYHGLMFAWGVLSLTTGRVKFEWKNIWKEAVGILIIIVWASIGNAVYSNAEHHYDWFFVTGSTFPFIPQALMPLVVLVAVFGMCAIIFLIDYGVKKFLEKNRKVEE